MSKSLFDKIKGFLGLGEKDKSKEDKDKSKKDKSKEAPPTSNTSA